MKKDPSEYVLQHTLFGMVRDAPVLEMGHLVPLERFVWGSDFPHSVGTFPEALSAQHASRPAR